MEQVKVEFPKLGLELDITREAFVIGDFAVYWYAILIAVGAILAVIYGMTQAKKYGINPDKLLDLGIVGLFFGIIGARLYYVLFNIENYKSFADVINIRDGGLAIYGGLILGVVSAFIASRVNKCRFRPCLDLAAGGFLIGQAIGRWGNFVNQEAFGTNTDSLFGMYSEKTQEYLTSIAADMYFDQGVMVNPSEPVHPCFLYESVWCILGFLILLAYKNYRKFDGELMLFYAAWYGTGRALIEGIRTDSLMIGPFRVSQLLSILIAVAAVAAIIALRVIITKKRKEDPDFLKLYVDTDESKEQFMESDEVVIEKAEGYLFKAFETLQSAEHSLSRISSDKIDSEVASDLEELAESMQTADETILIVNKKIELALEEVTLASTLLERFESDEVVDPDELIDEDELSEDLDEDEDEAEFKDVGVQEIAVDLTAQIESVKEYIDECYEIIDSVKEQMALEGQAEETSEEEGDEETREIHDTVTDEADELDLPSPNDNK